MCGKYLGAVSRIGRIWIFYEFVCSEYLECPCSLCSLLLSSQDCFKYPCPDDLKCDLAVLLYFCSGGFMALEMAVIALPLIPLTKV